MLSQTTLASRDVFHTVAGNAALCITAYWLPIAEMGSSVRFARCANRSLSTLAELSIESVGAMTKPLVSLR